MITNSSLAACIAEAKIQGFTMCSRVVFSKGMWTMRGFL